MLFLGDMLQRIKIELVGFMGAMLLKAINATLRWHKLGQVALDVEGAESGPGIFLFWHNRQLLGSFFYKMLGPVSKRPGAALISKHADGRIIARAMYYLGLGSVDGSSTRGGVEALLQLTDTVKAGLNVGITPDGPRGPIYKLKAGVVKLAQVTQKPLYPLAYGASAKWTFKSWDKMLLPKPFAKAVFMIGEPIRVPAELSAEEFERYRLLIEERLISITRQADNYDFGN